MITRAEKDALVDYLEFLLMKQLLEPIVDKHVHDPDVAGAAYDAAYGILNEIEKTIEDHRNHHPTKDQHSGKNVDG